VTFRKTLFWLHLIAGSIAGAVILIMSVTGVLLMYEKQMVAWADERDYSAAPPAGAARLGVETLIANAQRAGRPMPATVTVRSDPHAPVMLGYGREAAVYLNPYTGDVLGEGAPAMRRFFRVVTDWHRWLGAQGDSRPAARAITGACNLAFLFIVMTGLYLWWPRAWNRQSVRAVAWFRSGLAGKARDFNWHNVVGLWCFTPLFFIVLSGVVISYPWAGNLVYRIAGSEPPAQNAKGPGAAKKAKGMRAAPPAAAPPADLDLSGLDEHWREAERGVAGWNAITLRLPPSHSAPLSFQVDRGNAGQPHLRGTLLVDRATKARRWENFADLDAGRRLRSWLRFVHTGEYYGFAGQTIAGIASLGGVFLFYTGLALAWRRFRTWRTRRSRNEERVLVEN
jgi:uncharacterized iron-regulated membrane protein